MTVRSIPHFLLQILLSNLVFPKDKIVQNDSLNIVDIDCASPTAVQSATYHHTHSAFAGHEKIGGPVWEQTGPFTQYCVLHSGMVESKNNTDGFPRARCGHAGSAR